MAASGLAWRRLARLGPVLEAHVEAGRLPGAVALVARHGELHVEVVGARSLGGAPMTRDTIFRIASITKPIAAAVAMMLVEESVLRLDDPVDELLPELASRRVLRTPDSGVDDTVPAERAISLRDLLTLRCGYGVVLAPPGPIQKAVDDAGFPPGPPKSAPALGTVDEFLGRLGELPLVHQPGEGWLYQTGSTVLGALLTRATGQSLEDLFRERLFDPLGMVDTSFFIAEDKRERCATSYRTDFATGELTLYDEPDGRWSELPEFPDAGGDLVSTADDLLRFGRFLLDRGRFAGARLLSRPSVSVMTTDQLTADQKASPNYIVGPPDSRGWGLGMAVVTRRDSVYATPGRYGWDGGLGTSWANDPAEGLVGVLLTQAGFGSATPPVVVEDFWVTAYQAIDD